ncbi:hypothetical protein CSW59_00475 [Caulobacter sp. BP25]|nr:hypothetical protein CSW59_00475 [Caulobacter sp. BP25]
MSPLLFFWVTELFSGMFIESGAVMVETRSIGVSTGAFSRLAFFYSGFLILSYFVWSIFAANFKTRVELASKKEFLAIPGERVFLLCVILLLSIFFVIGFLRGFPVFLGADRFAYRAGFGSTALSSFLDNRIIIFAVLGGIFAFGKERAFSAVIFGATIVVSILFGEKFTSIVQGFLFFLIPSALARLARRGRLPLTQIVMPSLGVLLVTVPAVLVNYGLLDEGADIAYQRMFNRAALQGQLWFLADQNFAKLINFDAASISSALRSIVNVAYQSPGMAPDHGMYYVMRPFTDSWTMYWVQYAQGGFVFAHMPYWLMSSGYFGMSVVGFLSVLMFSWCSYRAFLALVDQNLIESIIWFKVFIWLCAGFTMGNIWFIFGVKSIVLIVAALAFRRISSGSTVELAVKPFGATHNV